ncbi:hypothetical protein GCM10018966_060810 [Streptomyces yanii]
MTAVPAIEQGTSAAKAIVDDDDEDGILAVAEKAPRHLTGRRPCRTGSRRPSALRRGLRTQRRGCRRGIPAGPQRRHPGAVQHRPDVVDGLTGPERDGVLLKERVVRARL